MKPQRIALLLGQELGYCRGVLSGVLDFAEQQRLDWTFRDGSPDPRFIESLQHWKPHGIIAHVFDRHLALSLQDFGVPVVNVTLTIGELPFPVVDVDHSEAGRMAADYLIRKGFHSFAYFGSHEAMFARAREQGFRQQLASHHFSVSSLHSGFLTDTPWNIDWQALEETASEWLHQLEKPVAILASNDLPGRHLAATCRQLGYRIPQDVAILGVDNDDSECRMTNPYLSSIALPTRAIGFKAGDILNTALKSGTRPGQDVHSIPPVGIIERQSTDYATAIDPQLERALKWIETHADQPLDVGEIARINRTSRRSLERLFQLKLGTSVQQYLIHCRLETAKALLRQSDKPLGTISDLAGFSSQRAFNDAFRKHEHMSPSTYRRYAKE